MAERVAGRAGWISFAMALPGAQLSGVAESYDVFGALLLALALEFTVEVRDSQTGGNLKDTRRVSKTIQRGDMQVLCAAGAAAPAPAASLSLVAGLLPGNASRFDNVSSDAGQLRSARARALSTLLLLGAADYFQTPGRMHDSLEAHSIVAMHFTSNVKLFKGLQLLRSGLAFAGVAGALEPTARLLDTCPRAGSNASRGCRTHSHVRARVLDFAGNSALQVRSLQSPRGAHSDYGAVAAWVAARGAPQPGFAPGEVYNHSRAAGAAFAVNARFRQAYLLAPQGAPPAQFVVTVSTWCAHSPAARAQPAGAFTVVAAGWLPLRGASFLDEPFWGDAYASALRELLGLFPREVAVNGSSVRRDANESLFAVHIVLPHAEPRDAQEQAARLAAVLDDRASGFARRLHALVADKLRAFLPDAALGPPRAALPRAEVRRNGAPPPAREAQRCGAVPHVLTQAYADTNNADNIALALATDSPANARGRVLQLTAELQAAEFCAAGSEAAVLALLRLRYNDLFVAASGGTIASIQPTAVVVVSDFECPAAEARRRRRRRLLVAAGALQIMLEVVLTPSSALLPMSIRATEGMYALGVRNVLIEPSALFDDVQVSRVSAVGEWVAEPDGTFSATAPAPIAAPVVVVAPRAPPDTRPAPTPAPPQAGDARALLRVSVLGTALSALYASVLGLVVVLSPRRVAGWMDGACITS